MLNINGFYIDPRLFSSFSDHFYNLGKLNHNIFSKFFVSQRIVVRLGINRSHAHLSEDDYNTLFGDTNLPIKRKLLQPGEYASWRQLRYKVWLDKPSNHYTYESYTIVGPLRSYSQLEITVDEATHLRFSKKFPLRMSGDTEGCPSLKVAGITGKTIKIPTFIALDHIHLPKELSRNNLHDILRKVRIYYDKTYIDLVLTAKYYDNAVPEIHLNEDRAQMFNIEKTNNYYCELLDHI